GFEHDTPVRQIAERLDGLRLALELAAARVKVLTPQQILERLGRSLELLGSGVHDAPERQRTMRGAVEWSYQLLRADEQGLFAQLAVFAGSFELEAAEAVSFAELDVLQSLVDKSLLRHGEDGRCCMLATIRELAQEKLGGLADASALRLRHDEYFLGVAEELNARERLSGIRDMSPESLNRFDRELPSARQFPIEPVERFRAHVTYPRQPLTCVELFRNPEEILVVAKTQRRRIGEPAQLLLCELSDSRKHAASPVFAVSQQTLVDQRLQDVELGEADGFRGLKLEAPREHGQLRKQPLLVGAEELITPFDGPAHGALSLGCVVHAGPEQLEAATEA